MSEFNHGYDKVKGFLKLKTTKAAEASCFCVVDLEGVEPSSKRGSHMLSTCLSLPLVFECRQDQSHQPIP